MPQLLNPVSISDKAIEEIKKIMEFKNIPVDYGLRVGIKGGGGCAGISYLLGFDKIKETDDAYFIDDIPVYIEKKHAMYLIGIKIDYYEGADAKGFTFLKDELNNE
ncbi:MAG: iron-sulfur cluster assembly accessory protein [Bacteroidota bacterium]|nr:iron-sulfur cluster assembly accessory protein [Bacteroidota bacterium]